MERELNGTESCEQSLSNFTNVINYGLEALLPLNAVKDYQNDQPWIAKNDNILYRQLQNKVNRCRKSCRKLYYEVKELKQSKHKDWSKKRKTSMWSSTEIGKHLRRFGAKYARS